LLRVGNKLSSTVEAWGEHGSQSEPLQNFFLDRYAEAYRAEMAHFVELLEDTASPQIGYRDGIWALAIAEAAAESHATSSVVPVSY